MNRRILITGGNGFIGSHIVRAFVENGDLITCLVRLGSSLKNLEGLDINFVEGDISDRDSLMNTFEGFYQVIHNAGRSSDWGSYDDFYQTNVIGTENVLSTCIEAGITQIIMTGSTSSYGEENSPEIKNERSPFKSHYPYFMDSIIPCRMNHYRDTKAETTQRAIHLAEEANVNLTILEPGFVYGEREFNTGFYEYVHSAATGMFVAPGSSNNHFPVIYAGDLARAYLLAAEKMLPGVERLLIVNREPELMSDVFGMFCRKAGVRVPKHCPRFLCYLPALLLEVIYTCLDSKKMPLLTRGRVNMFYDNVIFSADKAEQLLGFKASTSLDDGISKTVQWYKNNGYL